MRLLAVPLLRGVVGLAQVVAAVRCVAFDLLHHEDGQVRSRRGGLLDHIAIHDSRARRDNVAWVDAHVLGAPQRLRRGLFGALNAQAVGQHWKHAAMARHCAGFDVLFHDVVQIHCPRTFRRYRLIAAFCESSAVWYRWVCGKEDGELDFQLNAVGEN